MTDSSDKGWYEKTTPIFLNMRIDLRKILDWQKSGRYRPSGDLCENQVARRTCWRSVLLEADAHRKEGEEEPGEACGGDDEDESADEEGDDGQEFEFVGDE